MTILMEREGKNWLDFRNQVESAQGRKFSCAFTIPDCHRTFVSGTKGTNMGNYDNRD